jgi:hypothetical protein
MYLDRYSVEKHISRSLDICWETLSLSIDLDRGTSLFAGR